MLLRKYNIEKAKARASALTHELVLFVIVAIICLHQIFCQRSKDVPATTVVEQPRIYLGAVWSVTCLLGTWNIEKQTKHELVLCALFGHYLLSQNRGSWGLGMYQQQPLTYIGAVLTVTFLLGLKHWKTNKAWARALCTFDLCTFALSPGGEGVLPWAHNPLMLTFWLRLVSCFSKTTSWKVSVLCVPGC